MSYVIMALQEEGSETRISEFDKHDRGFSSLSDAENALETAYEAFPEYREIWIEELKDQQYWFEHAYQHEYDAFDDYERY